MYTWFSNKSGVGAIRKRELRGFLEKYPWNKKALLRDEVDEAEDFLDQWKWEADNSRLQIFWLENYDIGNECKNVEFGRGFARGNWAEGDRRCVQGEGKLQSRETSFKKKLQLKKSREKKKITQNILKYLKAY